jgi:hypothetical protein
LLQVIHDKLVCEQQLNLDEEIEAEMMDILDDPQKQDEVINKIMVDDQQIQDEVQIDEVFLEICLLIHNFLNLV